MKEPTDIHEFTALRPTAKFGGGVIDKGDKITPQNDAERDFYDRRERDGDIERITHTAKAVNDGNSGRKPTPK